jgi:Na+/phosphate symporter
MTTQPRSAPDAHLQLADKTIEMLEIAREAFLRQRRSLVATVKTLGQEVHRQEKILTAERVGAGAQDAERIFVAMHLERIGDMIEAFAHAVGRLFEEGVLFTDRATREIDTLLLKDLELLQATRDILRTNSAVLIRYVLTEGPAFESLATEFALFHQQRLIEGLCQPKASSLYLALVDYLRGIERHQRDIVQKLAKTTEQVVASGAARAVGEWMGE